MTRTLVAGIGNIVLGDDGFGVETARRLAERPQPAHIEVVDIGVRGVHLAYQLLDGYDTVVLVDATPRGEPPGTVTLLEADTSAVEEAGLVDAHGMDPATVVATVRMLGGRLDRLLVVGCEPEEVDARIGLSPTVAGAVDSAVALVREVVEKEKGVSP